ncbi:MAG: anaerobic ribonucleoside-triphosphate reductase activating protein [Campylobacterota bacterium]
MNDKIIYDITKFTHLDYPNHLACIVWFSGCSMRCDFCYNKTIVFAKDGEHSYSDVLEFLKTRVNLLEAVVLSGGEATSHELVEFCTKIKELGFLIKLDTNGTDYKRVEELLKLNLLDYVALDYKAPEEKFMQITHSNRYDEFSKTLNLLIQSNIEFEVRTTLHCDLLDVDDINTIIDDLIFRGYDKRYYIQKFLLTENNIGNLSHASLSFDDSRLSKALEVVWR